MQLGDREDITVRSVTAADMEELAAVTARAFEDDPLYAWFLPDPTTRLEKETQLNRATFPRLLPFAHFQMLTTTELAGLAVWAGPDKWDPPASAMLGALPRMLRAIGFGAARRMTTALGVMRKHHPKEPHRYLMGLATDPPRQRTGVGTALVAPVLERCDREHVGAYLETQKAENVPYYERFGFRVSNEIDLPKGGPHLWLMWRDPQ